MGLVEEGLNHARLTVSWKTRRRRPRGNRIYCRTSEGKNKRKSDKELNAVVRSVSI